MIIYRTPGPWGAGKGADLTEQEVDGNFHDLDTRVTSLAENQPVPVSVDHTEMIGNTFTVHLTNGQVDGPFEIPFATLTSRGLWGPGVEYNRLDYFGHAGVTYIVNIAHQSAPVFDPLGQINGEYVYAVAIPAADPTYDIGFFIRGPIGGNEDILFRWFAPRPLRFEAAQHDSEAVVGTPFADALSPPASLALMHLSALAGVGTQFGTITFEQGNPVGTVTITADTQFNIHDGLEVRAPVAMDSAANNLSVTLVAILYGSDTAPLPSPLPSP